VQSEHIAKSGKIFTALPSSLLFIIENLLGASASLIKVSLIFSI